MQIKWNKLNRKIHYWGSIVCAIPVIIVIVTGTLLLLKKEFTWVQPATVRGSSGAPTVSFEQILQAANAVTKAEISGWHDIDRLDIRPSKGVIKVRANNQWEIQLDHTTLKVLQVAYRRSDFIESIHDGSFFHPKAKLGIFLPTAIILLGLWGTGLYLFLKTLAAKNGKRKPRRAIKIVE